MNIGENFKRGGIFPDMDEFVRGMLDAFKGETRFSMFDAEEIFEAAYEAFTERRNEVLMQAGTDFLTENGQNPNVVTLPSGLQYEVISEGSGAMPLASDTVRVHYEGTLIDGTVFDSSFDRGEPAEFPLFAVIPGWTEGIQLMPVGSNFRFFIPYQLAYGPQGSGGIIPPFATLIFNVELLGIVGQD
jgi:FKBP-type peptidyl-prolyl cis-trans isomerase